MCDPGSENKLRQVEAEDALLEKHSDQMADLHTVTCSHGQHISPFCKDTDHRKLAICSIVCGLSCIGIMSLIYSVKARQTRKTLPNENGLGAQGNSKVKEYSRKALKWGIGSIVAWVGLIVIFPLLLGLLSYLLTLID